MGNKNEQDRNFKDELQPWRPDLGFDIEKKVQREKKKSERRKKLVRVF